MSILASNCYQVSQDPTNSSQAKQLFSFSKTQRFRTPRGYSNQLCYDTLKDMGSIQHPGVKTTFGIERPPLFKNKEEKTRPSPDRYNLKSDFLSSKHLNQQIHEENMDSPTSTQPKKFGTSTAQSHSKFSVTSGKRGSDFANASQMTTSFGVGREAFQNVVSVNGFNYTPFKKELPGPCNYSPEKINVHPKWSMRPRTVKNLFRIAPNPGPGEYLNMQLISTTGNYSASKHFSTHTVAMRNDHFQGPKKCDRISNLAVTKPGCTAYSGNEVSDMHSSLISRLNRKGKSAQKVGLGTNRRCESFKSKSFTPGPGSYAVNSAFGHYLSKFAPEDSANIYSCVKMDAESRATTQIAGRISRHNANASFQQSRRPQSINQNSIGFNGTMQSNISKKSGGANTASTFSTRCNTAQHQNMLISSTSPTKVGRKNRRQSNQPILMSNDVKVTEFEDADHMRPVKQQRSENNTANHTTMKHNDAVNVNKINTEE